MDTVPYTMQRCIYENCLVLFWQCIFSISCFTSPFIFSPSSLTATPYHIQYDSVLQDLQCIPGVKHIHSLHIWSLTTSTVAISAHLATGKLVLVGWQGKGLHVKALLKMNNGAHVVNLIYNTVILILRP